MACALVIDARGAAAASRQASASDRISYALREAYVAHSREQSALLTRDETAHERASDDVDAALAEAGSAATSLRSDHDSYRRFADPVFDDSASADVARALAAYLGNALGREADAATDRARGLGEQASAKLDTVIRGAMIVIVTAACIFTLLGLLLRAQRRRLSAARAAELERLAEMASSDPLTGLRNHRVFHEDLARELQHASRTGLPLALALVDLDDLKTLNDTHGHQAGDERIRALADTLRATMRGADQAYRIGGDEFAVILPDTRAWGALEFAQRLRAALPGFTATAGIAEAETLRPRDELIREADMALLRAKALRQHVAVYTVEMAPKSDAPRVDERHTQTLASALARAVDAKDSYTRSHCQTVSELAALIATELGFTGDRLARMRLAGLLHDVGKIGVPDHILNKPAALTDDEYKVMQAHAVLGFEIVQAAGLPQEAQWVRHHHERVDGRGYPDGLAGDAIPPESRIILVADAYEAMTSDRPYRNAPGQTFAVEELQRGAGTQFDARVVEALCRVVDRLGQTHAAR
ncbi:diguanylate cyclase (GGDEF)-like protein/putative nucleotidyltransferase with HDIG domain [Solirubrobacter pauli]|uniref:Diguanylate cyclase (GGDEF)-like protein/putative nucleotidyltransferase with HDIG domain n=2 Tax=Solirubrobacter pauli TaxID=166793 RepID=A0A660L1V6_9ACTN|nr:diguanylate cyclase (GGDEF)-like protein/putative nucleotidyltransferase with HDIG domain [Solirubrobacter pauli]